MATIFKFARFIMANLKIVATLIQPRKSERFALLINFHLWLLTIGPKLDFRRIFENFGSAILLHKLPTFHSFLTFLTLPCFGKSSHVCSVFKIFKNSLAFSPAKSKGLPMVSSDVLSGYWSRL